MMIDSAVGLFVAVSGLDLKRGAAAGGVTEIDVCYR